MKQSEIDRIHSYKLAIPGKIYTNDRGDEYIGTIERRLKAVTGGSITEVTEVTNNYLNVTHASTHQDGGTDEIDVTDLSGTLADPQKVTVHKNGTSVGTRPNINLIEGTNITLTVTDDGVDNEVDVTINSSGGAGYTDEQAQDAVGSILTDTTTINFTYNDAANTITADVQGLTSSNISDFVEAAQDAVGNALGAGLSYNDGTGAISSSITQYTDELAQDAVGAALTDTATIDFTYNDGANTISADVINDSITYAKIQNVSATDKLLGRVSAGSGDVEEITLDPDGALTANSDDVVPSQQAVKEYVDSQFVFSKSTSDQTTTSTSLIDITNIGISIAANQNIYFKALLKVGCSATNGARWAVTIPTGATMFLSHAGTSEATRALAAPQWLTTSGTEGATTNAIINTNMWVVMEGWVYNGANSGTIQVQGRTINAANTVTIYSGSMASGNII